MSSRTLSALLFGFASALLWLGAAFLHEEGYPLLAIAMPGTLGATIAGAWVGGNFAQSFQQGESWGRGAGAGAIVTGTAYVLGAALFASIFLIGGITGGEGFSSLATGLGYFVTGLAVGLPYLAVAMILGGLAGHLLWHLTRRSQGEFQHSPPPPA